MSSGSGEVTNRQREMLNSAAMSPTGGIILLGCWDRRIANGLVAKGLGYVDDSGRYAYGAHFVINDIGRRWTL